jgi:nucleotide-binding universal stress UspA family protein
VLSDETTVHVSERRSMVAGVVGRPSDEEVLAFAFEKAAGRRHGAGRRPHLAGRRPRDAVPVDQWVDRLEQRPGGGGARARRGLAGWRDKVPDVPVREVVLRDKTTRGLLVAALTAGLLVIGHRRRNRLATLGSTTHGVLHRATSPLAVVPLTAPSDR